ncbi:ubiquinol-cytochrome c reductase iron-sulfur subunit [Lederbergia citrea]|uniref:Rieske 2Fe-2S domain-containing protein n=1 Tax=Lederbergia citrea TaxID=2833581 RepID=A0A942UNE4_9BACI|nr:Rieske 2Fe-2S domain-containing protein [Lederbergia citrea]MBS4205920.1 Rieske 2Fe-2S domain-containing protein [Lederbergia citrea]MBS4224631.1 Rieske 2Fe-2S domain-containing protein [Lederbergia citrea]
MNDKNNKVPFAEDNYTHNINRNMERKLDRRGFMKTLVGAAGLFAVSSLPWGAVAAKELMGLDDKEYPHKKIVDVSKIAVGEAVDFKFPAEHDSAILIRLSEKKFVAYQNACTHLRCPVFWEKDAGNMICPCHHGVFDAQTGVPTAGPPRRPLPGIEIKVEGGTVYAVRVKRYEA